MIPVSQVGVIDGICNPRLRTAANGLYGQAKN
jgi:hypothetical protein